MDLNYKKIGVLFDYLGPFQYEFLEAIQEVAEEQGFSVLSFVGRELETNENDYRLANRIFDLAHEESLAGLIVFYGVANFLTETELSSFIASKQLPVVSLGQALDSVPSVSIDQAAGMRALMRHLCDERGYKDFAFIRGWSNNSDSELREAIFCEELTSRGLAAPESRRVTGNFTRSVAAEATRQLLDGAQPIEVIVAANDNMARGAMTGLTERGLRVPQDVAVVGFDDSLAGELSVPPLTTVRQPLGDMGREAARLLLAQVRGKTPQSVRFPAELIIRRSCGDPSLEIRSQTEGTASSTLEPFFQTALATKNFQAFLAPWEHELRRWALQHDSFERWFALLEQFTHHALSEGLSKKEIERLHRLGSLARSSLVSTVRYTNRERLDKHRQSLHSLMHAGRGTWKHDSLEELMQSVKAQLPLLGIDLLYIILYEQEGARLRLAYGGGESAEGTVFERDRVLPSELERSVQNLHLTIFPLFTAETFYGYMMIRPRPNALSGEEFEITYSSLQRDISNGIEATLQRQEITRYTASLEELVKERTEQLELEIQERKRTEEALKLANEDLALRSMQDGMTGLYNRAAFDDYLKRQWLVHRREKSVLSLIICDVDHFKLYNDHYGHLQGDECLRQVSGVLKEQSRRPADFVARFGGEEFVLLLPNTDEAGAQCVAQNIFSALRQLALPHETSPTHEHITLSMGICTLRPTTPEGEQSLIGSVDQALYRVKQGGRNGFQFGNLEEPDLALEVDAELEG